MTEAEFQQLAGQGYTRIPVIAEARADFYTPLALYIKLANTPDEARQYAAGMLGQTFKGFLISRLLVEEAVDIAAEYYLAITIDRASKSPIMICSAKGGVWPSGPASTRRPAASSSTSPASCTTSSSAATLPSPRSTR